MRDGRPRPPRLVAQDLVPEGDVAPAEEDEAAGGDGLGQDLTGARLVGRARGQEDHAHGEVARRHAAQTPRRQLGPQHVVGDLGRDPGAVPGAPVRVHRAPVGEPIQGGEGEREQARRGLSLQLRQETNPTRVVVKLGGARGAPPRPPARCAGMNPAPLAALGRFHGHPVSGGPCYKRRSKFA